MTSLAAPSPPKDMDFDPPAVLRSGAPARCTSSDSVNSPKAWSDPKLAAWIPGRLRTRDSACS